MLCAMGRLRNTMSRGRELLRSRRFWLRLALCANSGVAVALCFPPFDLGSLVWLAFVPLLCVLWRLDGERRWRRAALYGGFAGLISCTIQFWWFGIVAPVAALLIPAYLALYWAAFACFAATWGNPWRAARVADARLPTILRSLRFGFGVAAAWAALEWVRGWMFTGFGWNSLGVAFHQSPVMAQSADLFGVTALSMVPIFLQVVLLQSIARVFHSARDGRRRTRLDFGIAALMVAVLISYGLFRIASESRKESIRLKALLVQLNIPQQAARVLWEPLDIHIAYEEETLGALEAIIEEDNERLQQQLKDGDLGSIETSWPDWVMWPEAALSGSILRGKDTWGAWIDNNETIARVRQAGLFQLIYGVTEFEAVEEEGGMMVMKQGGRGWNSLAVMDPDNNLQTHRKHHLVWFGETIPLIDHIPWLRYLYESQSGAEFGGSFTPGTSTEPLPVPLADGRVIHTIPSVCFEDSVPRLTRKFIRPAPQVIVNVTNDGWFKDSAAAAQHFAYARFRCIELRRPMLRCANNGVSAAINTLGTTAHPDTGEPQELRDAKGSHFTRGSLLVEVDVPQQPTVTLYSLIGDWGVIVISFSGLLLAWLGREGRTAKHDEGSELVQRIRKAQQAP